MDSNTIDSVIVDDTYTQWQDIYNRIKPGGNLLIISTPLKYHRVIINAEDNGFEVRDMIQYIAKDGVYTIGLCRKPLSEKSVVENVIRWGVGGLNIDECRIGNELRTTPIHSTDVKEDNTLFGLHKTIQHERVETTQGRWPANIIFECTCEKVIKGDKGEIKYSSGSRDTVNLTHEWGYNNIQRTNYTDTGNIHTDPNCPCYILDKQSGNKTGQRGVVKGTEPSHSKKNNIYGDYSMVKGKYAEPIDELGGASRFFASFNTKTELLEYLTKLINPKNGMIYIATE
jgi:hypothetical protein